MFLLLILFVVFVASSEAAVIHVPLDQPTIQAGIDAASEGDTVLLADGTYQGEGNRDISFQGKTITVTSEHGAATCIVDCGGSAQEEHTGFGFFGFESSSGELSGVTIKNAYRQFGSDVLTGAVHIQIGSPVISDCVITQNHGYQGGGIHCRTASPVINRCTITHNTSIHEAAGIYCYQSAAMILNCTIAFNTIIGGGEGGSGMFCVQSHDMIVNCDIHDNTGATNGGGILQRYVGSIIAYCYIHDNEASTSGAGIYCIGSSPYISHCTITNNTANYGAGVRLKYGCFPPLTNCLIAHNTALISGGGCYLDLDAHATITNCTITGNSAATDGGGIAQLGTSNLTLINSILSKNTAVDGVGHEIAMLTNTTVLDISYSVVSGGQSQIYVEPGSYFTWGPGMLDTDPLFTSGPHGAFYLSQIAAGQTSDSLCVDAGNRSATDLCFTTLYLLDDTTTTRWMCMSERSTRTDQIVDRETVDIGYHYYALPTPTPTPSPTPEFETGVELTLSKSMFHPGDRFHLTIDLYNYSNETLSRQPLAIVLDVHGTFFWYPLWREDVDYDLDTIKYGVESKTILDFVWPADVGADANICFYAALLTKDITSVLGGFDVVVFGWE